MLWVKNQDKISHRAYNKITKLTLAQSPSKLKDSLAPKLSMIQAPQQPINTPNY